MIIATDPQARARYLALATEYAEGLRRYLKEAPREHMCGTCLWISDNYDAADHGLGYRAYRAIKNGAFGEYVRGLMHGFESGLPHPGRTAGRVRFAQNMLDAMESVIADSAIDWAPSDKGG